MVPVSLTDPNSGFSNLLHILLLAVGQNDWDIFYMHMSQDKWHFCCNLRLQTGTLGTHCPFAWHLRDSDPWRINPLLQKYQALAPMLVLLNFTHPLAGLFGGPQLAAMGKKKYMECRQISLQHASSYVQNSTDRVTNLCCRQTSVYGWEHFL